MSFTLILFLCYVSPYSVITKTKAKRQSSVSRGTQQSMQSAKKTAVATPKIRKSGRAKPPGRPPAPKKESSAKKVTPKKKVPKKVSCVFY